MIRPIFLDIFDEIPMAFVPSDIYNKLQDGSAEYVIWDEHNLRQRASEMDFDIPGFLIQVVFLFVEFGLLSVTFRYLLQRCSG